ncbi:hypothetical protein AGMMS50239_29900 [Bacteroidia bacterium]|nr:hypothetical protein AGMMS50239_29900 [Bacteroidia bacterium]GHV29635.1 hypothetical protein FACS1894177_00830 [Bacteroidia bacterium]
MDKEKKNILDWEGIDKINVLETDFRAEILAAGLIEDGYNPDKIHIIRQGGARRGFSKDIEEINLRFSEYDLEDYLEIQTNKDGIYDILPEGIFHQSVRKKLNQDKEEVIDEIKRHRLEEFYARKFFQLFEVESDYALTLAYLYEIQYDKKISNSNYTDIFIVYWPVLKLLKPEQRVLFMHTIPYLHQIRNNHDEIEKNMSILLEVPVKIENIKLPAKNADSFFESNLNKSCLGMDLVLGKTFDDGQYDLKVTIGPISAKKMEYFLETSVGNTILDFLCDLFFPGDAFVVKDFKVFPEDAAFVLSYGETNTFLGINTFI